MLLLVNKVYFFSLECQDALVCVGKAGRLQTTYLLSNPSSRPLWGHKIFHCFWPLLLRSVSKVASVVSDSVQPHRWQPTRLPRPWDSPGKNTGCHFLLQCMKVRSESEVTQSCLTLSDPMTAAYQATLSMGFSRQEYWSGVPLRAGIL